MKDYILSLSDSALIRFHFRIWRLLCRDGAALFGLDWRTIRQTSPQLAEVLSVIMSERARRDI